MVRIVAVLTALVLLPRPPAPQELKSEVLDKLKSATVYVVVESPFGRGTGSGFLFLKRGPIGYIMTCEHVVGRESTVKVVFWSGTKQEKTCTARVVATDPSRDIACLLVRDVPGLPAVLELGRKTEVKETETVFAAGFPFGAMLASGDKNPEISVSKSSVSSIRRNDTGDISTVQISGEINPGNSGGPLVTGDGRVIGVTAAKIRGTQTAFAVPSEEIQGFLKGRIKASSFRKVGGTARSGRYEVTLDLVDPLATLKGAGIAYVDERQIKEDPTPEKDGSWKKVNPSMKSVAFKIDEDRAVETLEFGGGEGIVLNLSVVFQCYYIRPDGQTVWTEPKTKDIDFGADTDPAAGGPRGGRKPPGPAERPDDPEPPPAPEPSAGPTVEIALPDAVTIAAELPASSVFGGLLLAPDGSVLYALDLSEGQLYKLDPENLQIKAKLEVHETSVSMGLTPDGKTLYIGGKSPALERERPRDPEATAGTLQVINTTTFTRTDTLEIKHGIVELAAADRGIVAATCQTQWDGLVIIDVAKKSEETVRLVRGGSSIRLSRDQRRVYVGDYGVSPGDFRCVSLRRQGGEYAVYDSIYHGEHVLGGPFEITPDGKHLIGGAGAVLRLSRDRDTDLRFESKIAPFNSVAMAPGCSSFFTTSRDGFLKSYDMSGFEVKKSIRLGFRFDHAVLDLKRRKLHGVVSKVAEEAVYDPWERNLRLGRLSSLSLGGK